MPDSNYIVQEKCYVTYTHPQTQEQTKYCLLGISASNFNQLPAEQQLHLLGQCTNLNPDNCMYPQISCSSIDD